MYTGTFDDLDVLPLTGSNDEEDRGGLVGPTKLEYEGTGTSIDCIDGTTTIDCIDLTREASWSLRLAFPRSKPA